MVCVPISCISKCLWAAVRRRARLTETHSDMLPDAQGCGGSSPVKEDEDQQKQQAQKGQADKGDGTAASAGASVVSADDDGKGDGKKGGKSSTRARRLSYVTGDANGNAKQVRAQQGWRQQAWPPCTSPVVLTCRLPVCAGRRSVAALDAASCSASNQHRAVGLREDARATPLLRHEGCEPIQ